MEYPQAGYSSHEATHKLSRPTSSYPEQERLPPRPSVDPLPLPPQHFIEEPQPPKLLLPKPPRLHFMDNAASLKETYAQVKSARERLVIGIDYGTTFCGIRFPTSTELQNIEIVEIVDSWLSYPASTCAYRYTSARSYAGCPPPPHENLPEQFLLLNETIPAQLIEALDRLLLLWLSLLQRLLSFCKFSEFPNRLRPRCTTMPWTIWPALVVLWGVCWMFIYGEGTEQDGSVCVGLFGAVGYFETDQGLFVEPMPEPFVFETDQFYQESLDFTAEAGNLPFSSTVFDNAMPSPLASALSGVAFATDTMFPDGDPILPIESGMPAVGVALSDFSNYGSSEIFTIPAASAGSSESSANNPAHPRRVPNCHRKSKSKAAPHEHENRYHTKPYKCKLKTGNSICGRAFSRAYELKRHQDTVHKMAAKVFFCGIAGCKHSRGQIPSLPFLRRDKLFQHQKQVGHGDTDRLDAERSSQDADTIPNASRPSGGDVQVQPQNGMELQIQVQASGLEHGDNGMEAIREPSPVTVGEASRRLVTRVKAMKEKHATEMARLKEQQDREMRPLKEELESYEREIATLRGFLGD